MDNICAWIHRMLRWVERAPRVPLDYVSVASSYRTAPAPFLEIVYLESGEVSDLCMGTAHFCIPPQHLALHNVHFGNTSAPTDVFRGWCVFLDVREEREFAGLADRPLFCCTPVRQPERLLHAFQTLNARARLSGWGAPHYPLPPHWHSSRHEPDPASQALLKAAFLELLGFCLQEAESAAGTRIGPLPAPVQRALEYIHAHYQVPRITLADIANAAHLSEDHFGRLFRRHLQTSPLRFVRQLRIDQSRFLLRHTDLRIEEIGRDVGFPDPFHFSRAFRAVTGTSPRAFRKQAAKSRGQTRNS